MLGIDYLLNSRVMFWFLVALILSINIVVLIGVFLAYRRLDYMERLLNKCSLVIFHSQFWGKSPRGRMMRLSAVAVAVLLPTWNLKRGVIDWQQVQEFPRSLKNLFRGIYFVIVVVFMCSVVFWLRK